MAEVGRAAKVTVPEPPSRCHGEKEGTRPGCDNPDRALRPLADPAPAPAQLRRICPLPPRSRRCPLAPLLAPGSRWRKQEAVAARGSRGQAPVAPAGRSLLPPQHPLPPECAPGEGTATFPCPEGLPPHPAAPSAPVAPPPHAGTLPSQTPARGGDTPQGRPDPPVPPRCRGGRSSQPEPCRSGGKKRVPPSPPGIAAGKGSGKRPGSAVPGKPSHQPSHQPSDSPVTKPVTIPSRSRG